MADRDLTAAGRLFVVSTPIGNLEDVTFRAVRILKACDLILAEDTRRTARLLREYGISTRLASAHEHNEAARVDQVLGWLREGRDLALVSDAGTPLLSDPGERLVRAAVDAGLEVLAVPGPSAVLGALVVSGLPVHPFRFVGFPPRKRSERDTLLDEIAATRDTVVLYESPQRLVALLDELGARTGPDRRVVVARELTKLHEEIVRGSIGEVGERWRDEPVRGEIVVIVEGTAEVAGITDAADREAAEMLARSLVGRGLRQKEVVRELRRRLGVQRNEAYEIAMGARGEGPSETGDR